MYLSPVGVAAREASSIHLFMYPSSNLHPWPSTCLYIYLCLYLSPVGEEAR